MEAAREGRCSLRNIMLGTILLAFGAPLVACCDGTSTMIAPAGPTRTESLVQAWASHIGAPDRHLDATGDIALGETGLAYDAGHDVLYGRAWINMARTHNAPPERIATYRRMAVALNDPKIGGMYDRAGGHFVLDEARGAFFLVRAFPVRETTEGQLVRDMEKMRNVADHWTMKWFLDVAMVMHGKEKALTHPILIGD